MRQETMLIIRSVLLFVPSLVLKLLSYSVPFARRRSRRNACTYVELKDKLNKQFGTKKLVLAERYRFYAYKQHERQSLSEYLAELRRLVSPTCQWSEADTWPGDNLRDKFVMGLRNERILQQLLTQDHTKSLDELFQLATTIEAAERETVKRSEVDRTTEEEPSVSALRNSRPPKGTQNKQSGLPRRQQQRAPREQHTAWQMC